MLFFAGILCNAHQQASNLFSLGADGKQILSCSEMPEKKPDTWGRHPADKNCLMVTEGWIMKRIWKWIESAKKRKEFNNHFNKQFGENRSYYLIYFICIFCV